MLTWAPCTAQGLSVRSVGEAKVEMAMELDTNGILKVSACDKVRRQRHPTPPSTTRPNHKRTLPSSPQVNVVQIHVLTIHVSVDHGRREFSGDHKL